MSAIGPIDGEPGRDDESDLVARAQAGDPGAFAALSERHRPGLVRCATLLIGDADEAESIAQEALTRALAGLGGYDPATPFPAWARGIVLNLARQHRRRAARHAAPTDPAALADAPEADGRRQGVLSAILRDELSRKLWLAVGQLPEAYREAVVLHYVEGLDYAEISRITGASPGALRNRAMRGRSLLRGSLGPVVDTWLRNGPTDDDPA